MDNKLDIKAFLDKDEQKDLLRLLTAGSVDDGKSTLIGRLLFDSKKLYEDQLDALERDSKVSSVTLFLWYNENGLSFFARR